MSASRAAARSSTLTGRGALRGIKVHPVRAIVLLKFEEMEPLADWFADRLVEVVRENGQALEADGIVPVPLHKIRRRERGFNQAELLSKRLAKRLKLPHQGILLVRKRPRPG